MVALDAKWVDKEDAWLARLVQVGVVIRWKEANALAYLALSSGSYGFWVWRLQVEKKHGEYHMALRYPEPGAIKHMHVTRETYHDWRVLGVAVLAPWEQGNDREKYVLAVVAVGKPETLLEHAAHRGFRGLSVAQMGRLFNVLKIPLEGAKKGRRHKLGCWARWVSTSLALLGPTRRQRRLQRAAWTSTTITIS